MQSMALDRNGVAEFRVPAIAGLDPQEGGLRFVAAIGEPGFCEAERTLRWSAGRDEYLAKLTTRRGATLHGSVVGVDGKTFRGSCSLALLGAADPRRPSRSLPIRTYARDGRFALDLAQAGTMTLVAYSAKGGSQRIPGLELDPASLPGDLIVRLEGRGTLAGRVLDPSGAPVPHLSLQVAHNDEKTPVRRSGIPAFSVLKARAGGHRAVLVSTDAEGRFEARGLLPGPYRFYDRGEEMRDIGGRAWSTGATGIELLVDAFLLTVAVEDADGRSVEVQASGKRKVDSLALLAQSVEGEAPRLQWRKRDGVLMARAMPGVVYAIGVWGAGYRLVEERVVLSPQQRRADIRLRLRAKEEPAGLRIQALGHDGAALRAGVWVRIYSDSGQAVLAQAGSGAGEALEVSLPPGNYRVGVQPMGGGVQDLDEAELELEEEPALLEGPTLHLLELRPGEIYEHRPRMIGMGWLRLQVKVPGELQPSTRVAVEARRVGARPEFSDADSASWRTLEFRGALDPRASFSQAQGRVPTSHGSIDPHPGLLPNLDQRCGSPLEAGTWELRITCEGHVPQRASIDLVSGQESVLELELLSR